MREELFEALAKYEKIPVEEAKKIYEEGGYDAEDILKAWLRKKLLLRYEKELWEICKMAKEDERLNIQFNIECLFIKMKYKKEN